MKRRTLLGVSAALLLIACGNQTSSLQNPDLGAKNVFPAGKLHGSGGKTVDLADFRGKALIVFFGYTSCPDICPTTLRKYASLYRNLRDRDAERVQVIFISVDPERDTPDKADTYAKWFNPNFIGLTGDNAQIADLAAQFGVIYAKQPVEGSMGYVIDHSAGAYLVDPKGQLRAQLPEKTLIEPILADLQKVLDTP